MKCTHCSNACIRNGRQPNGRQKYFCRHCQKNQQQEYSYHAYQTNTDKRIVTYLKESCAIRSISRIMKISTGTVLRRIRKIAGEIEKPCIVKGKEYEMDEMKTYIRKKKREYWVAYAIRRDTREVIDFKVGKRTKRTLQRVADTLFLCQPKRIFTDRLHLYEYLIPEELHEQNKYKINYIERKNLSIRTHLKRLGRKTICYSKCIVMLEACLKIYFWG